MKTKLVIKSLSGSAIGALYAIEQELTGEIDNAIAGVVRLLERSGLNADSTSLWLKIRRNERTGEFVDGLFFDGDQTLGYFTYVPASAELEDVDMTLAMRLDLWPIYQALKTGEIADLFTSPSLPQQGALHSAVWTSRTGLALLPHGR